jgi:hypothetical protein
VKKTRRSQRGVICPNKRRDCRRPRKRILVKDEALFRPSAIVASRPRSVKGLAMNGPTKTVGPPWTPLPARKTAKLEVCREERSGARSKQRQDQKYS